MIKAHVRIMINRKLRKAGVLIHCCLCILIFQTTPVSADNLAITSLQVVSQTGDNLLIAMEMNGPAVKPKIFHTDNPPRIALDFPGVKNALDKKMYSINQGVVNSLYVAEAPDRIRIVVNLLESANFDTNISGNKLLLALNGNTNKLIPSAPNPVIEKTAPSIISQLIPQQNIKSIDFKRGDSGEGRILVSLANPNTVVNTREEGGNVVLSFMNTYLPPNLAKRLNVTEFATPVKYIDANSSLNETTLTITPVNSFYDYSLLQSEGLLTVDFRPLTSAEKEVLEATRNKYTGDRLSLNFQEIDIRSVIAVLAEFTGQNVVAGDEVRGNVTVKLDDVPWDEALDFIMMTKGLEKYETGNVTLIAPVGKIKEYKEKQKATEMVVEELDPLITEYLKINYARAENFRNLLYGLDSAAFGVCSSYYLKGTKSAPSSQAKSQGIAQKMNPQFGPALSAVAAGGPGGMKGQNRFSLLSSRGSVVVDARTNTLIVRETPKRLEEIKKLIRKLDVPVKQVMIESRIVLASNTFARELGVKFGAAKFDAFGSGINFAAGGAGTSSKLNQNGTATTTIQDTLVDLAASNPYGALGMTLARGADYVLNLELSALQDSGKGQVISNPRVMTTDRCQATISQGTSVPYQTSSQNGGTNVQFIDANLSLNVTPQITPSGSINMELQITRDDVAGNVSSLSTPPPINTNSVKTNVLVNDGETVVLGGIYRGTVLDAYNKVPFFAELPGLGFLFKKNTKQNDKSELLVFVTPKIVKEMLANK